MKSDSSSGISRLLELAQVLEKDIEERKLKAGDSYLTTSAAAAYLEVGSKTANQVLQVLEKKGVLHRAQRRGAVIAQPPVFDLSAPESKIETVYFLFGSVYRKDYFTQEEECSLTLSLQEKLKKVDISAKLASQGREFVEDVGELISSALQMGRTPGFICLGCPPEVQRLVAQSGLPAVVWGTCHASITGISSLESDFESAATQSVALVERRNRQRVIFITHNVISPGVHVFLDGFRRQLGSKLVCERFLPVDQEVITINVQELFRQFQPDVWYLKYSCPDLIMSAIDDLKRVNPGYAPDVIYEARYAAYKVNVDSPCYLIATEIDPSTLGRMLGNLLLGSLRGDPVQHVLLPMQLSAQG
ncbi:MAG: GntR family transcriptional regulator [Planctomycetia bacterium]|nr:GntR family transcriptional regulator [Planctomycetia bacterium]